MECFYRADYSQEVEFLVQRLNKLLDVCRDLSQWLLRVAVPLLVLLLSTSCSYRHVELSNFVSVLARCWHFDWTGPVEVEVA